jgi:hypothetical protein
MAEHTRRWYIIRFVLAMCAAAVTYYVIERVMPRWFQNLPKPLPEVLTHPVIDSILEGGLAIVYGLIALIGGIMFATSVIICILYSIIAYSLGGDVYVAISYGLWAGAVIVLFVTSLRFFIDAPWKEYDEEFGPDPGGCLPIFMLLQFFLSVAMLSLISLLHGGVAWDALDGRRGWVIFISAITFIIGTILITFAITSGERKRPSAVEPERNE